MTNPGHQPRRACGSPTSNCGRCPRWTSAAGIDSCRSAILFVERARSVAPGFSMAATDEASAVVGDLPPPRRDPVGHRVGGVADGVDDRRRGARSSRSAVPAAGRFAAWAGRATRHCATRSRGPTTCSTTARETAAGTVFGVRRGIRPRKCLRRQRVLMMSSPHWICSTPWCASRCWSPTGPRGEPGFRCWRRSASSPRSSSSRWRRSIRCLGAAHARYFAGREADVIAVWDSPRQREAYEWFTVEMANLRFAFPVGCRPR